MSSIHTIPVGDLIEHDTSDVGDCICGPEAVPIELSDGSIGWQILHHALDGREHSEPDHDRDNCPLCTQGDNGGS